MRLWSIHPQLERFRRTPRPLAWLDAYLQDVVREAHSRGYAFDRSKIDSVRVRDPARYRRMRTIAPPPVHPLFTVVAGEIESWERR